MIPKNIHLSWMQGFDKLPDKFKPYVQSVADKNQGWNIYKWDDESIKAELKKLGQEYIDKYNSFKLLHQKVDYARYALLYIYGGVSVDTDVMALKGFDSTPYLETSSLIVSEKPHSKSMNNATILSSKNNQALKYLIDNIPTTCDGLNTDYTCIQRTTGPYAFHKLLSKFKDEITILDKSYFEPCASLDPYCTIPDNTILDHRHELSWLKPSHKNAVKMYFIAKQYKYQIIIAVIVIILLVVIISKSNH